MVRHVLAGGGAEHLQEGDLVAVSLVREAEALLGDVREPGLALAVLVPVRHLLGQGRLGLHARGLLFHVAVDEDGVLGVAGVGIDPVLMKRDNFSFYIFNGHFLKITSPLGRSG